MLFRKWRHLSFILAVAVLLLTSCGNPGAVNEPVPSPAAPTRAPTSTTRPPQATETTVADVSECEEETAEIAIGTSVKSEIMGKEQPPSERKYFCVFIPEGVSLITFELTDALADLNLLVGHPDLKTLQEGGLWFWFTNERGSGKKTITVEPAISDHVNSGLYYIEVNPENYRESSPFTLTVSTK